VTLGFISDETLLGYLLGALEDQERSLVLEALLRDKHLQVRLNALRAMSGPMLGEDEIYEPPGAMVSRIMCDVQNTGNEALQIGEDRYEDSKLDCASTIEPSNSFIAFAGKNAWIDTAMSLTAAAIGFCLVAPAILQTRESARTSQCASGLMTLGQQIRDFAFNQRHSRVPEVEVEGPLAFAGVYAIRLNDAELLNEKQVLWCPSSGDARLSVVSVGERKFPSAFELKKLPANKRRVWQHIVGGSYAYNLGVVINNQHTMPSLDDTSDVAILADAPGMASETKLMFTAHQGVASNVLYRDGRVRLLRLNQRYDGPDHPYLNRNGETQAGVGDGDSALGASYQPPLGPVR
jgi:hypothetical protein